MADTHIETAEFDNENLDTRTKLILVAERLFGERGIDAVPLREVVVGAGQRNASALSYHIGGRDELVLAVLEFRRAAVDARRMELLDEYTRGDIEMDETAIAAGIIIPLIELMMGDPRGGNYLRFLSQALVTERPELSYRSPGETERGMRRCYRLYRGRHATIASRLVRERFAVCIRGVFYSLADWHRDVTAQRSSIARTNLPDFASDLITVAANGLVSVGKADSRFALFSTPRTRKAA